ncbi:MAG: DEAD/DEAH box helicase [Nitrospirota bacterium]|nr:DEAD/DEAH box helicase [Nitrospirota bacterium]
MSETPSFAELGLKPSLVAALAAKGITDPTPVQTETFAPVVRGGDLIVQSRTGSGKTLAYGLPLIQKIDASRRATQVIILAPTRELAAQVTRELKDVAQVERIEVTSVTGGESMSDQLHALKRGTHIVVGTPGRIMDHLERRTLKLENVDAVVLDEGDEMLDMGFLDDITAILEHAPPDAQILLFSATLPPPIMKVAEETMIKPELVRLHGSQVAHTDISHHLYVVPGRQKFESLVNLLLFKRPEKAIIFCRTRQETDNLAERLRTEGFLADAIHGDLSQSQRNQAMAAFRKGKLNLLIATDVAARGIDVPGITHVINYALPNSLESYVHRSGRTGRCGAKGKSISLITPSERSRYQHMLQRGRLEADWQPVPEPDAIAKKGREDLLNQTIEKASASFEPSIMQMAEELLQKADAASLIAALLVESDIPLLRSGYKLEKEVKTFKEKRPGGKPFEFQETAGKKGKGGPKFEGKQGRGKGPVTGYFRFRIDVGGQQQLNPGGIIQLICKETGIKGPDIGAITIRPDHSYFEVRENRAGQVVQRWKSVRIGKKPVVLKPA